MNVFEMIEAQQKGLEDTTVFMVGEQLKDICRADPGFAAIVAEDLQQKGMGIADCEKKIKAAADKLAKEKKLRSVGINPIAAEDIIRKFYGLPERDAQVAATPAAAEESGEFALGLDDLLGI